MSIKIIYKPADPKIKSMQANKIKVPIEVDEPLEQLEVLVKAGILIKEHKDNALAEKAKKEAEEAEAAIKEMEEKVAIAEKAKKEADEAMVSAAKEVEEAEVAAKEAVVEPEASYKNRKDRVKKNR